MSRSLSSKTAAGIGRHQSEGCRWAIERGGHVRTGLEDNIRVTTDRLDTGHAEPLHLAAEAVLAGGKTVATPAQARALRDLRPA